MCACVCAERSDRQASRLPRPSQRSRRSVHCAAVPRKHWRRKSWPFWPPCRARCSPASTRHAPPRAPQLPPCVRCSLMLRRVRDAAGLRRLWRVQLLQLDHAARREASSPTLVLCPPFAEVILVDVAVIESFPDGSRRARIEPRRGCEHGRSGLSSGGGRLMPDHADLCKSVGSVDSRASSAQSPSWL